MMLLPDGAYLSLDGLPTPHEVASWLGVDGNTIDYTYVDQDHDGLIDHMRWQVPVDLFPEEFLGDTNLNDIPDSNSVLVDLDGDGLYETHLNPMDLDHDGQVDHWVGYTGLPHVVDVPGSIVTNDVHPANPFPEVVHSAPDPAGDPLYTLVGGSETLLPPTEPTPSPIADDFSLDSSHTETDIV